jgi:hypothetical protein
MKCSHRNLRPVLIMWYDRSNKKRHEISYLECKEPERTGSFTAVAWELEDINYI